MCLDKCANVYSHTFYSVNTLCGGVIHDQQNYTRYVSPDAPLQGIPLFVIVDLRIITLPLKKTHCPCFLGSII